MSDGIAGKDRSASGAIWRRLRRLARHSWSGGYTRRALAEAERQAGAAEARLREAIDALPEGIVILDPENRYMLWNKQYAEIYKTSADLFGPDVKFQDTLRIGVARGDYPEALGREEEWIAERLAKLGNPADRHEQRLADGRWIMIEERRTKDGGVIGVRVDITEMKRQAEAMKIALERAETANRSKSAFLANMSHEIRTPLKGVLGLADVLSRTELDDTQRELVRTIVGSAEALNDLLGDLLDLSRLEAGKVEISHEPFSLGEMVVQTMALFEPSASAKGLTLRLDMASDADGSVIGDRGRLKQILTNLLSNAIKFTANGEVALSVGAVPAGDGHRYTFQVRDTGIGFQSADADRLFARFEQLDGSVTRAYGGTGLGLAICRQLSRLMGGTLKAEGSPGEGAVFTLALWLAPAPASEDDGELEPAAPDAPQVLLAEDNPVNRQVVELMLGALGAQVTSVCDGRQAVDAMEHEAFDVVLMDLQMPVMDGLSATRAIRAREHETRRPRTPIVVLSANVMPEHLAASAAAGADDHIGKPIRAETLIGAIARALDGMEQAVAC